MDSPEEDRRRTAPREVPEIREAIALLEGWEKSAADPAAARSFTEALELLDEYLECEPGTPHRAFVQNLKLSHTRSLLRQLARVGREDFGVWLEYALAVAVLVDREAKSLMAQHPELKKEVDGFLEVWGEDVRRALPGDKR